MDCDIFQDEEFEPAAVTERLQPSESMDKDLDSSNITTNTQSKAAKILPFQTFKHVFPLHQLLKLQ